MKQLLIKQCPDPMRWYSNLIGQYVPFFGDTGAEYRSREPAGYTNFVQYEDAEIIQHHWEGGTKETCDCPDCGRSLIDYQE
jgi:hypothetical protein